MKGFSTWLAGGGITGGFRYPATDDDLSYNSLEDGVHGHDLLATIVHQFGIDHAKLKHRFEGRDFRPTDVHGKVVSEILA